MNAEDLKKIVFSINSAKNYFKGVFSINTLPKSLSIPSFLICNFDIDSNPGSHWFCLFKTKKNEVECFDSLGLNEQKQQLLQKYCKFKYTNIVKFNDTPVQSSYTSTCGKFVLYFAIQRLHNLDVKFTDLLNEIFEENILNNETVVESFFSNLQNEQSN